MPLITDPDSLSQGASAAVADAVFTVGSPLDVAVITSAGTNLPTLVAGEFFEVRGHSDGRNNGLYQEIGGSPTTASVTARKITGSNPVTAGSTAITTLGNSTGSPQSSTQKSVHIATGDRDIYVLEQGNVDADGVVMQSLYSFLKEEWKDDNTLIPFPFPMTAITPEQFEFSNNWNPADDTQSPLRFRTSNLIRTGGWAELDTVGLLLKEWAGIISLGSFVEATDRAYFQQGDDPTDTGAAIDFVFDGPVNEAIQTYGRTISDGGSGGLDFTANTITRNDGGDWVAEGYQVGSQVTIDSCSGTSPLNNGTFTITAVTTSVLTVQGTPFTATGSPNERTANVAFDHRNALTVFLREGFTTALDPDSGKTYAQANLADIGVTTLGNQVYRFPLANSADLKVTNSDATVSTRSPTVTIEYFATPQVFTGFNADAGSTLSPQTTGAYGIVIDAKGLTAEEVYEYVQYQLRQAANINDNTLSPGGGVVTGRTADELLAFVGDSLGTLASSNPSGGGTGVYITNFSAADTNRISFIDNDGLTRTFPFVAAGVISFNDNLQNDSGPATFTMFFEYTSRVSVPDLALAVNGDHTGTISSGGANLPAVSAGEYIALFGFAEEDNNGVYLVTGSPTTSSIDVEKYDTTLTLVAEGAQAINFDENPIDSPDAIIVNSNSTFSPLPITGIIQSATVSYDFDYDGNAQGGRTPGTDANVVVRAIGTDTAQFVQTTGSIARSVTNNFSLVAPLERNFSNP